MYTAGYTPGHTPGYTLPNTALNDYFAMFQSTRKSALITAAKKARLKTNPSRVRFAEAVIVNGAPVATVSVLLIFIILFPATPDLHITIPGSLNCDALSFLQLLTYIIPFPASLMR